MSDLKTLILDFGRRARAASRQLARLSAAQKNAGLLAMADEILAAQPAILAANARDVEQGKARELSVVGSAWAEGQRQGELGGGGGHGTAMVGCARTGSELGLI